MLQKKSQRKLTRECVKNDIRYDSQATKRNYKIPEENLDSEVLVDIGFASEGGEYNVHYVDFYQDEEQLMIGIQRIGESVK